MKHLSSAVLVICVLAIGVGGFLLPASRTTRYVALLVASASQPESSETDHLVALGDDDEMDEEVDVAALRELFVEAVQQSSGGASVGSLGNKKTASLDDLDEAQFKLLMLRRLGQEDYDRIFKHPRVEVEVR